MKQIEVKDVNGNRYRVVRCRRGGWAIWKWSNYYRAWVGDPPARGPFRTQREALAEAKARVEEALVWRGLNEQRDREGREAMRDWMSR
jgi:hypothetical protein